jgi:excisionase family DNA binding protein
MVNSTNRNTDFQSENSYTQGEHFGAHLFFDNLIWLTTDEAAIFLRKSSHALRQMTYKGRIRPRKFGGRLYFKKAELDQLIDTSFY